MRKRSSKRNPQPKPAPKAGGENRYITVICPPLPADSSLRWFPERKILTLARTEGDKVIWKMSHDGEKLLDDPETQTALRDHLCGSQPGASLASRRAFYNLTMGSLVPLILEEIEQHGEPRPGMPLILGVPGAKGAEARERQSRTGGKEAKAEHTARSSMLANYHSLHEIIEATKMEHISVLWGELPPFMSIWWWPRLEVLTVSVHKLDAQPYWFAHNGTQFLEDPATTEMLGKIGALKNEMGAWLRSVVLSINDYETEHGGLPTDGFIVSDAPAGKSSAAGWF